MSVDQKIASLRSALARAPVQQVSGRVLQAVGTVIEAELPGVAVGSAVQVAGGLAEVIGFREGRALIMPMQRLEQVGFGARVRSLEGPLQLGLGPELVGRVIDGLGNPADGGPPVRTTSHRSVHAEPPDPMTRSVIHEPLATGVRVLDGLLTIGRGQRIGIMAGSGVGKSTLMGMLAKSTRADVNVICLLGERGREVREFIERDLGEEGRARSVVVVVTGDKSPVLQVQGAFAAMTVAEYFRDQGQDVLLMMDSVTRFAMAQRQIGLAAGEPPTRGGYTPSVFALLPRLLERAGPGAEGQGSITAICTVLVEGDDVHDPIGDAVRGIVDGHVVLSRTLASHGHYPAVDVLGSVSRVMPAVTTPRHQQLAQGIRDLLARWAENEELVRLGAYRKGSSAAVDEAMAKKPYLDTLLRQGVDDTMDLERTLEAMQMVVEA